MLEIADLQQIPAPRFRLLALLTLAEQFVVEASPTNTYVNIVFINSCFDIWTCDWKAIPQNAQSWGACERQVTSYALAL